MWPPNAPGTRPLSRAAEEVVFTPPYMSYANHYILSTIAQLQPDGETVFAYDIKMGNIQKLVSTLQAYDGEELMIFDREGTIIGSTDAMLLRRKPICHIKRDRNDPERGRDGLSRGWGHLKDRAGEAKGDRRFCRCLSQFSAKEREGPFPSAAKRQKATSLKIDGKGHYGYLLEGEQYSFLVLVPKGSMLAATVLSWLVPLLLLEILLIYIFGRVSKAQKNRELRQAYVELGQTQRRLEIALSAAQKAAAIDDLTGHDEL